MCEIIWLFLFIELYFDKKIFNKKIFNYINVNIVISALAIIYLVVVIIVENSFPNGYYKVFFELLCSVIICLIWKMKILTSLSIVGSDCEMYIFFTESVQKNTHNDYFYGYDTEGIILYNKKTKEYINVFNNLKGVESFLEAL